MKALFIVHAPVYGGPHNTAARMSGTFRDNGHDLIVLLPEEATAAANRLGSEGAEVLQLPLHRIRKTLNPAVHIAWARTFWSETGAIAECIRRNDIDVVATNSLPNLHGAVAARRAEVALVWEIIDSFVPAALRRALMPFVVRVSDAVITTGVKIASLYPGTQALGDRWFSFYPCVDTATFTPNADTRARVRDRFGLSSNDMVIGTVGNLNPMKGHKTFVRAASELRRSFPDAKFLILGASYPHFASYIDDVVALAESLGLLLGRDLWIADPKDKVCEYAQALDVFWLTSEPRSEGIPTVIGEAKSLGIPVVAVDVGSTSEAVTDGVSGYVVDPHDATAIADRTRSLLNAPELARRMGQQARHEAERQFATAHGAHIHIEAYEAAINHRSAAKMTDYPAKWSLPRGRMGAASRRLIRAVSRRVGYDIVPLAAGLPSVQRNAFRACDFLVDVGANAGQFAERARNFGYRGEILSYEPGDSAFSILAAHAEKDSKWHIRKAAVGQTNGSADLYVAENSVSSSLLKVDDLHLNAAPESRTRKVEQVEVVALDDDLTRAPLFKSGYLKIDVQGLELPVLEGAVEVLERFRYIQTELSFRDLYQDQSSWLDVCGFLQARGFDVIYVEPGFEDGASQKMLQADMLFERR